MTDNTRLNPANANDGGDLIATDDIGGVKFQRVKIVHGADGTNDGDVAATNPLPMTVYGLNDAGDNTRVPVTAEGHLEVAVHGPRLPFGSLDVASLHPVFQTDGVYGINADQVVSTTYGNGSVTESGNLFTCSTGGTTAGDTGALQSRKRLRYRPGQGIVGRFAGLFTTGIANTIQTIGFGTSEAGFYFGYNGTSFGILHVTGGVRAIHTLTVTTASTATNNYVVTLNDVAFNVTATANSSTTMTAYEISKGTYTGWTATQVGATVIFLAAGVGAKAGAFTLAQTGAGTPAAGSFATTKAGVLATDTWYPQAEWNGDPMNGSGPSGMTIDPTKGNVYQVDIQYLGFGAITFKIEAAPSDNNPEFVTVHTLRFPNTLTAVHTIQPSFPFTMAAYNSGTAAGAVSCKVGSFAGFVAGEAVLNGPRMSYLGTATSSTSAYTPLFTVRNNRVYKTRANQAVVRVISVSAAAKSNTGITTFYLLRDVTLSAGVPNFTAYATNSCTAVDTAATACTIASNSQIVWSGTVSESGDMTFAFSDDITLQPGETMTLAVRSVTATATCVGGINTREDQ